MAIFLPSPFDRERKVYEIKLEQIRKEVTKEVESWTRNQLIEEIVKLRWQIERAGESEVRGNNSWP
ncbi:MAG TPA: hypothetical protein VJK04_01905 [Candidatus Paceibacterota bacterium]